MSSTTCYTTGGSHAVRAGTGMHLPVCWDMLQATTPEWPSLLARPAAPTLPAPMTPMAVTRGLAVKVAVVLRCRLRPV